MRDQHRPRLHQPRAGHRHRGGRGQAGQADEERVVDVEREQRRHERLDRVAEGGRDGEAGGGPVAARGEQQPLAAHLGAVGEREPEPGATGQRLGKFELCDGGTIFLDEIGDMALATQTKILRVLQQGEIQRVGGTEMLRVDVRILAATNKDLEAMVRDKTFREDLYYRLNVVRIRMPALRERGEDIPQIVDFCLQNLARQRKTRVSKVSPEALALLLRHGWPGNVRELENTIYRSAVVAQGDAILVKDLPAELGGGHSSAPFAFPTGAPSIVSIIYILILKYILCFLY